MFLTEQLNHLNINSYHYKPLSPFALFSIITVYEGCSKSAWPDHERRERDTRVIQCIQHPSYCSSLNRKCDTILAQGVVMVVVILYNATSYNVVFREFCSILVGLCHCHDSIREQQRNATR